MITTKELDNRVQENTQLSKKLTKNTDKSVILEATIDILSKYNVLDDNTNDTLTELLNLTLWFTLRSNKE